MFQAVPNLPLMHKQDETGVVDLFVAPWAIVQHKWKVSVQEVKCRHDVELAFGIQGYGY